MGGTCTVQTLRNSCKYFSENDKKNWLGQSQKFRGAIQGHLGPLVIVSINLPPF